MGYYKVPPQLRAWNETMVVLYLFTCIYVLKTPIDSNYSKILYSRSNSTLIQS